MLLRGVCYRKADVPPTAAVQSAYANVAPLPGRYAPPESETGQGLLRDDAEITAAVTQMAVDLRQCTGRQGRAMRVCRAPQVQARGAGACREPSAGVTRPYSPPCITAVCCRLANAALARAPNESDADAR